MGTDLSYSEKTLLFSVTILPFLLNVLPDYLIRNYATLESSLNPPKTVTNNESICMLLSSSLFTICRNV